MSGVIDRGCKRKRRNCYEVINVKDLTDTNKNRETEECAI